MNNILLQNIGLETFAASFLIWIVFFGLLVLYLTGKVKKEVLFHAYLAFFVAWIFGEMVKDLIPSARPYWVTGAPPLTFTNPTGTSFPSTHAAASFALAVTVWLHNKNIGVFFLIGAVLIALGRVVANVHYPIDVVAGAILGSFVAIVINNLHVRFVQKRKT